MNKLTIPTILVATVMVAGIFAFAPVQNASTVHTTILDGTQALTVTVTAQPIVSDNLDATAGADSLVVDAGDGTVDVILVIGVVDPQGNPVTGLVAADFTISDRPQTGSDAAAPDVATFAEIAAGVYTFGFDADDADFGADNDIDCYTLTVDVDDVNNDATTLDGAVIDSFCSVVTA